MNNIAQTFYLDADLFNRSPHCFLTSVVLYFKTKPNYDYNNSGRAAPGVTVKILNTVNGVPDLNNVMTRSTTRLDYSLVNTSLNADFPIAFKLRVPQPLGTNNTYAFLVIFEDPGYSLWTNKSNEIDIKSGNLSKVSSGKSDGNMWEITNGNVISPLVNADLTYELLFAKFNPLTYSVRLVNEAYEFIKLDSQSLSGNFIGGEYVYQQQPYANGTASITSGSNVVIGSSTDFGNTTGSWYNKISNNSLILVSNSSFSEIKKVSSVTNSSQIITFSNFSSSGNNLNIRTFEHGSLSVSTTEKRVEGTNTQFLSTVNIGDVIVISDGTDGNTQVRKVEFVYSNTSLLLDYPLSFSNNDAGYYKSAVGKVDQYKAINSTLVLYNSSANSTFYLEPNRIVKGVDSSAKATISRLFDLPLSRYKTAFTIWPVPLTTVTLKTNVANSSYYSSNNNLKDIENDKINQLGYDGVIASRSNEVQNPSNLFSNSKSVSTVMTITSTNEFITNALEETDLDFYTDEFLINNDSSSEVYGNVSFASASFNSNTDVQSSNNFINLNSNKFSNGDILRYVVSPGNTAISNLSNNQSYYVVSANSSGIKLSKTLGGAEIDLTASIYNQNGHNLKRDGIAFSKYISKLVTLGKDQIAEDLIVYMTAYKPKETDIEVYAKLLNEEDIDGFGNKNWTKMELNVPTDSKNYSLDSNLNDYVNLTYVIPFSQPSIEVTTGTVRVNSATNVIIGNFNTVNTYIIPGDLVKIYSPVNPNEDFFIDTVITSNTSTFTISENISNNDLVNSGSKVNIITNKNSGYLDNQNFNVVRYYNSKMSKFDGFKYFAIKIILKSGNYFKIPRVQEYRAIAVSA